jgi:hypothetical protein
MKHPCRTMYWWDNRKGDKKGGHVNGRSAWGGGGGIGLPCRISAIPLIQISDSSASFLLIACSWTDSLQMLVSTRQIE